MSARAEAPKSTQLYGKLSPDQQSEFNKVVIEKLRTLIGGYGELSVLAEYIAVMLQSSRPQEQIQSELEAFLQDQSRPFTQWLCDKLANFAGEDAAAQADASKGEALLMRAVRDARQGAEKEKGEAETGKRRERGDRERKTSRTREKRSRGTSAATATTERASTTLRHHSENHRSRSRQKERPRRRHRGEGEAGSSSRKAEAHKALREVENGNSAGSREPTERKAVLTPNVQFLRDAYHQKNSGEDGGAPQADAASPSQGPPPDTRWSFRAEPVAQPAQAGYDLAPPVAAVSPAPPAHPGMGPAPPMQQRMAYGPPPTGAPPAAALPGSEPAQPPPTTTRPRHFPPKKWRVVRANTVVRATERLDSQEVQTLQEGEIVEQVAPQFKLKNGIVRMQIRHPSSPLFPNPIGWVTQDATAAGGPQFLQPGPEPMTKGWRPPSWSGSPGPSWRPRGPPGSPGPAGNSVASPRPAPVPRGPFGFQNLIWKPSGGGDKAAIGGEPVAAQS